MSSGIAVSEDVVTAYQKLKTGKKVPWVIFKIEEEKKIIVEYEADEGATFEEFTASMIQAGKKGEGRYAVYDVKDESNHGKILFIHWVSDGDCKIKSKMLYASSKSNLIQALGGHIKEVQINDESDLNLEHFKEAAFKK